MRVRLLTLNLHPNFQTCVMKIRKCSNFSGKNMVINSECLALIIRLHFAFLRSADFRIEEVYAYWLSYWNKSIVSSNLKYLNSYFWNVSTTVVGVDGNKKNVQ